jgi:DNA-binding PadR family transcriptional regulator
MPEWNAEFPEIDRVVHEPARLAILTVLSACRSADFLFLQTTTGLSKGNLSVQLTKLEQAGLIRIEKEIAERKTRTTASLSPEGSRDLAEYWKSMDEMRKLSTGKAGARTRGIRAKMLYADSR